MKILVKAIVSYPVFINQEIEVSENTPEAIAEAVKVEADKLFPISSITPIITDSESHPQIVD
jgi:hypothetical protein